MLLHLSRACPLELQPLYDVFGCSQAYPPTDPPTHPPTHPPILTPATLDLPLARPTPSPRPNGWESHLTLAKVNNGGTVQIEVVYAAHNSLEQAGVACGGRREQARARGGRGGAGGGAGVLMCCLPQVIRPGFLSRRSTVPVPNRGTSNMSV